MDLNQKNFDKLVKRVEQLELFNVAPPRVPSGVPPGVPPGEPPT